MLFLTLLSGICKNRGDLIEAAAYDQLLEELHALQKAMDLLQVTHESPRISQLSEVISTSEAQKYVGVVFEFVHILASLGVGVWPQ